MVLGEKGRVRRDHQNPPRFPLPSPPVVLGPHNGLWLQGEWDKKAKEQPWVLRGFGAGGDG